MTVLTFSSGLSGTERRLNDNRGRLITCHPDELRPHPSYIRHNLAVHACQLSAVAGLGDLAERDLLQLVWHRKKWRGCGAVKNQLHTGDGHGRMPQKEVVHREGAPG